MYFSQSSDIELVIRNVTVQHSGVYTCTAQNIAGISESTTNVSVICKMNRYFINYFSIYVYIYFLNIICSYKYVMQIISIVIIQ